MKMVQRDKLNNALAALNAVLVTARTMAYEQRAHADIANVLDAAEYLPRLLADLEDQTDSFRETILGLVKLDPGFNFALERFDNQGLGRW
jgi:hypothetical protein